MIETTKIYLICTIGLIVFGFVAVCIISITEPAPKDNYTTHCYDIPCGCVNGSPVWDTLTYQNIIYPPNITEPKIIGLQKWSCK